MTIAGGGGRGTERCTIVLAHLHIPCTEQTIVGNAAAHPGEGLSRIPGHGIQRTTELRERAGSDRRRPYSRWPQASACW